VLGGQVVAELDAGGQKTHGYVYEANGALLAVQQTGLYGTHANIVLDHRDISGESERVGYLSGVGVSDLKQTEMDAVGADMGMEDPYAGMPLYTPPDEGNPNLLYSNPGRFFGYGCSDNGMQVECEKFMEERNTRVDGGRSFTLRMETQTSTYHTYAGKLTWGSDGGEAADGTIRIGSNMRQFYYRNTSTSVGWAFSSSMSPFAGIGAQQVMPQSAKPDAAGCDNHLAEIFGGNGAKFATDHDPDTLRSAPGRNRLPVFSEDPRRGQAHLYAGSTGEGSLYALAYTPTGYFKEFRYAYDRPLGGGDFELQNNHQFFYKAGALQRYGYSGSLQINFVHTGPTDINGRPAAANRSITNGAKSISVGIIGGFGNVVNGKFINVGGAGVGGGNVHTHMIFYQLDKNGNRGALIDPRKVFCHGFGF
jgi:hypothetical protein